MAYKNFVAGEEALASDVNSYLMGQAVARFPNASTRTSQLAAPVLNQLSMLDTAPGRIHFWNGTGWADSDSIAIAYGTGVYTTDAAGFASLSYPGIFAAGSTPAVVANFGDVANPQGAWIACGLPTASSVTVRVHYGSGFIGSSSVRIIWMAVGPRA